MNKASSKRGDTLRPGKREVGQKFTGEDRSHRFWTGSIIVMLLVLVALVFGQTAHFDFVNYDDQNYVYQNPEITRGISLHSIVWAFSHVHSQNWHPLTTISHMLDCQWFGLRAGEHHLGNVVLHALTAVLLFLVLRQLSGAIWRSAFVAALFAIHPLRVESVAWISERKDVLSGLFFMLTLSCYAGYARRGGWSRYLLLLLVFAVGLLTKPMLVSVPFVLLLLDYWPLQRLTLRQAGRGSLGGLSYFRLNWDLVVEKLPLMLLSAISCIATLKAQGQYISSSEVLPLSWRIGNACTSYLVYIVETVWPLRLSPFYPHPVGTLSIWQVIGSALILTAATLVVFVVRRRNPYFFTGWFWYIIMLIPVIGIVQVGWQGHADRYTYLPGLGLLIALSWGVGELATSLRRKRMLALAGSTLVVVFAFLAWRQTGYWRNSEVLWTHALTINPSNDVAENNLGVLLIARGQIPGAMAHYEKAIALRPTNTEARSNLANALLFQGKLDQAVDQLQQTLAIQPDNVEVRNTFGAVLASRGEVRAALTQWEQVLAAQPQNGNAQANLAWVLSTSADDTLRNGARALDLAQRAIALSGEKNAMLFRTLAAALAENGRFAEAAHAAEEGLEVAALHHNSALMQDLQANIALYRAGTPLRVDSQYRAAGQANQS